MATEGAIEHAMKTIENGSKEYSTLNEPGLSHLLADFLNLMGWRATADAPEIYSASAERAAGSVFTDFGVGIALEQHPFEQQVLRAAVEDDVAAFFRKNAGLAQALVGRGIENPVGAVPRYAMVGQRVGHGARPRNPLLVLAQRIHQLL